MKTKKLILALTLPLAFAACSNEDFTGENATTPINDNMVELGEGFVLSVQGINDAATRGFWDDKTLAWTWKPEILEIGPGNSIFGNAGPLQVIADEIGLCSTGEYLNGKGSIGSEVYTNYQFLHSGWLATGQENAELSLCAPYTLQNGLLYPDVTEGSLDFSSTIAQFKEQLKVDANKVTIGGTAYELDLKTGVFSTENKAIMGGSYVVYYPYNDRFVEVGSLPATATMKFENVTVGDVSADHVAKNSFLVGYGRDLIGGQQASKFSLSPLSAIVSLQLKQTDTDAKTPKNITRVALWSEDGFVSEVNLDAAKIKAQGASAGEKLYVDGTKKTTSTIVASLNTAVTLEKTTPVKIYLPLLPTTATDLKVILFADDESIAIKELNQDYTFGAAQGKVVSVDVVEGDFKTDLLIAVDKASLKEAILTADAAPADKKPTIQVIGDITLTSGDDIRISDGVTIEGGKLIVAEGAFLRILTGGTIKSTVDIQGQTCCGTAAPGDMRVLKGATVAGDINVLKGYGEKAAGTLSFTNTGSGISVVKETSTITSEGTVLFQSKTDIYGTLTNNGSVTIEGAKGDVSVKGGTVNNNSTFEVIGNFAMLDASGSTVFAAGRNFKNNGKFIDNVGATVGGATQNMEFGVNGDYICRVDNQVRLDAAYLEKTACSTIEFVGAGVGYDLKNVKQHNSKHVNLIYSATSAGSISLLAATVAETNIGSLTVKTDKLTVGGTNGAITVNGDLAVMEGASASANVGKAIVVTGNIVVDGTLATIANVKGMKAANMTINKGGKATFGNRNHQDVTLAIAGYIDVKDGATFSYEDKGAANVARVTCIQLKETSGSLFSNGKPDVVAAPTPAP